MFYQLYYSLHEGPGIHRSFYFLFNTTATVVLARQDATETNDLLDFFAIGLHITARPKPCAEPRLRKKDETRSGGVA